VNPQRVACDAHPDYRSTRHAIELGLPMLPVQHHYAHILSCMAEHGLRGPVLGVSWDGTGYGPDGTIWGGEFLHATLDDYTRVARLRPFPLPGGVQAVHEPRRAAAGILYESGGEAALTDVPSATAAAFTDTERVALARMLSRSLNCPLTSSMGRLFDAVASLSGCLQCTEYEGQAGILLESAARKCRESSKPYPMGLRPWREGYELDWAPLVKRVRSEQVEGLPLAGIAAGFHDALAAAVLEVAARAQMQDVVLSGGCFQNVLLSEKVITLLQSKGFKVHWHQRIPPNDGGLSLGQAVYALRSTRNPTKGNEVCA
jgi:hydrogenase maturation protein HypF